MHSYSIPILTYHQVTPNPLPALRKYIVTPRALAMQMAWLAWAGYVPIDLDQLIAERAGRGALPARPVVITFDDAYEDCARYAMPILQGHGFKAIFYMVAGLAGQGSRWLLPRYGVEYGLINWESARRLEAAGFQIGSHTLSHPHLADIPANECRKELIGSRMALEDRLGHEVRHLAYPFGCYNDQVRALAIEAGYWSACSMRPGLSTEEDDVLALRRVHITGQDTLLDFYCRLHWSNPCGLLVQGRLSVLRRLSHRDWGVQPR